MVEDESCHNFKKGTNFSENLIDAVRTGEKILSLLLFLDDGQHIEVLTKIATFSSRVETLIRLL